MIVVALPAVPGGKFRVLHKCQWRGMDFEAQAEAIRTITKQYNVAYNEIEPLQRRLAQLNDWIGDEVVRFNSYSISMPKAP